MKLAVGVIESLTTEMLVYMLISISDTYIETTC